MSLKSEYTAKIKSAAHALGFLSCGIAKADFLEEEASRDKISRRVHDAYTSFKKDIRKFALLKGAKMRI